MQWPANEKIVLSIVGHPVHDSCAMQQLTRTHAPRFVTRLFCVGLRDHACAHIVSCPSTPIWALIKKNLISIISRILSQKIKLCFSNLILKTMINISDKALNKNLLCHRASYSFNRNLNALPENLKFKLDWIRTLLSCKKKNYSFH